MKWAVVRKCEFRSEIGQSPSPREGEGAKRAGEIIARSSSRIGEEIRLEKLEDDQQEDKISETLIEQYLLSPKCGK